MKTKTFPIALAILSLLCSCKGAADRVIAPDSFIASLRYDGLKGDIEKYSEYSGEYTEGATSLDLYSSLLEKEFDSEGRVTHERSVTASSKEETTYTYDSEGRLEKKVKSSGTASDTTRVLQRKGNTIRWILSHVNPSSESYVKEVEESYEKGHLYRVTGSIAESPAEKPATDEGDNRKNEDIEDLYFDEDGRISKMLASYWHGPYAEKRSYDEEGFLNELWTKDKWEERTIRYTILEKDSHGNPVLILAEDSKDGKKMLSRKITYRGETPDSSFKEPSAAWERKRKRI